LVRAKRRGQFYWAKTKKQGEKNKEKSPMGGSLKKSKSVEPLHQYKRGDKGEIPRIQKNVRWWAGNCLLSKNQAIRKGESPWEKNAYEECP